MPTAIDSPCPSAPEEKSIPATFFMSG